ncbi:hypothetical protein CR513_13468, partial [Mucuna pruriens]
MRGWKAKAAEKRAWIRALIKKTSGHNGGIELEESSYRPRLASQDQNWTIHGRKDRGDAFAWSPKDMPEIDLDFLCHRLSITPRIRSMCQRKKKAGEGKDKSGQKGNNQVVASTVHTKG